MTTHAEELADLEARRAQLAETMRSRAAQCRTMTIAQIETTYRVDLHATVATIINAELARQWAELDTAIMLAKAGAKPTATEGPGGPPPAA